MVHTHNLRQGKTKKSFRKGIISLRRKRRGSSGHSRCMVVLRGLVLIFIPAFGKIYELFGGFFIAVSTMFGGPPDMSRLHGTMPFKINVPESAPHCFIRFLFCP